MLRFYKSFIYKLFILTVWAMKVKGATSWGKIRVEVLESDWWNRRAAPREMTEAELSLRQHTELATLYIRDDKGLDLIGEEDDMSSALELFGKKLFGTQSREDINDSTIIDTIVRVLQFPYVYNRIQPAIMKDLRKAILLPEEGYRIEERLIGKELVCSCGSQLHAGEICVMTIPETGRSPIIQCARCAEPTKVACATVGCGNVTGVDRKWKGIFKKHKQVCMVCDMKAKEAQLKETTPEVEGPIDDPNVGRIMEEPRQPGRLYQPAPPVQFPQNWAGANVEPTTPVWTAAQRRAAIEAPPPGRELRLDDLRAVMDRIEIGFNDEG